jgi:hypothetical protein
MKKITLILTLSLLFLNCHAAEQGATGDEGGLLHHLLPNSSNFLNYATLILAVFALYYSLKRPGKTRKSSGSSHSRSTTDLQDFDIRLADLKDQLAGKVTIRELMQVSEKLTAIEERLDLIEHPKREVEWSDLKNTIKDPPPIAEPQTEVLAPQAPPEELHYAKMADLENGFSTGILSTVQNGEQIYEITTHEDSGVYRISENPNAQRYALAEFNFTLGKACDLQRQPFKDCRIMMISEGTLQKIAGNWIIQKRAKIDFR